MVHDEVTETYKNILLKKMQEGTLKKEKVAEIFNTSVANVEEAITDYEKMKNPFRKRGFEVKNAIIQISISIISTLLVLFTLFEMQEARNATYMPDIVLDKIELVTAWDVNGVVFDITEEVSDVVFGLLTEDELNEVSKVKVYNIGVGIAKDIVIRWNHKKNLQQFSEALENCDDISLNYQNGIVHVTTPNISYGTGMEAQSEFEFMLNSTQEYNTIMVPIIYTQLYRELLIRTARTDLPILYLDVSFSDVQGKRYSKQISLNMEMLFYMEDMDGNGCCKYQLVSTEEEVFMGFEEFFETHQVADWILNIFKTISPTLIALLTIWINSCREKKNDRRKEAREKEKDSKKTLIKCSEDIREDILRLNSMVWNTGKELLDSIQFVENEEISSEYFDSFYENNKEMLVEARRINAKADIYLAVTGLEKFIFTELFNEITRISNDFIDVLEKYNKKASVTEKFNELFDQIQKELIELTYRCEHKLVMYCVELTNISEKCSEIDCGL